MKKTIENILFYSLVGLLLFILLSQLGLLPFRFVYLFSGSMRPIYQPGDLAVVYVPQEITVKPGEVILFTSPIGPTIHRVVSIGNGLITTRGDANDQVDAEKVSKVEGKVLFMIPKLGYGIEFIKNLFRPG
jgi:signal peptidase I